MKRYYLFLVLASLVCIGFARVDKDDYNDRLLYVLERLKAKQQFTKIGVCSEMTEGEKPSYSLKSGKTAYGYLIGDESCYNGENIDEETGLFTGAGVYSFDIDSPGNAKQVFSDLRYIVSGAYYNGFLYVEWCQLSKDGTMVEILEFGKIDVRTGEYAFIADWKSKLILFNDMTYDYSSNTMLGIAVMNNSRLCVIDIETGEFLPYDFSTPELFAGLSCKSDGTVYGVDTNGDFFTIGIDGKAKFIGKTGEKLSNNSGMFYFQSMTFDHSDGTLYWATINGNLKSKLASIDIKTGQITSRGTLGNNAEVVALYIPTDDVGVEDIDIVKFEVYPNPAKTNISLKVDYDGAKGVDFYDATGRLCKSVTVSEGSEQETISISDLRSGVYFLKLTVGDKIVANERLVVE